YLCLRCSLRTHRVDDEEIDVEFGEGNAAAAANVKTGDGARTAPEEIHSSVDEARKAEEKARKERIKEEEKVKQHAKEEAKIVKQAVKDSLE
ncbi:21655_t:CDS:2, partial [Gigaspora margarita]